MKKLVYSSDDVGYTLAYDLGAIKAFDEGISTHADVMFDSPHTVELLHWLKDRPWLSLGWHRHLWERPVADHSLIPHMVDEEGRFRWRHHNQQWMAEVPYQEAYTEFMAEMDRCYGILGKYPDICTVVKLQPDNELEQAFKDVCDKLGIMYGFKRSERLPKWEHIDLAGWCFGPNNMLLPDSPFTKGNFNPWTTGVKYNPPYDLSIFKDYNTTRNMKTITWDNDEQICWTNGHTGYLDDYIMQESSATIHRVEELRGCCDPETKKWIIDNKIELCNFRDALLGTHEYQDHLKEINSPMWVGNF
ncbi:MAG: ChbG/HpnK family deacetylase [Erysipelotrichaceae bacterium]|nr:ChbG/HpnK family deacetylase [Erysipelotrichaceae bacterium]